MTAAPSMPLNIHSVTIIVASVCFDTLPRFRLCTDGITTLACMSVVNFCQLKLPIKEMIKTVITIIKKIMAIFCIRLEDLVPFNVNPIIPQVKSEAPIIDGQLLPPANVPGKK